jgi:hypothetical protein
MGESEEYFSSRGCSVRIGSYELVDGAGAGEGAGASVGGEVVAAKVSSRLVSSRGLRSSFKSDAQRD